MNVNEVKVLRKVVYHFDSLVKFEATLVEHFGVLGFDFADGLVAIKGSIGCGLDSLFLRISHSLQFCLQEYFLANHLKFDM